MEPEHLPFAENTILTGSGESFPIPLSYKGLVLYFASLDRVKVPLNLQASLAYELNVAFGAESFASSTKGDTEVGRVAVSDGNTKRIFEVAITLVETPKDDYYRIESILEVTH